jgi:DNA-binding protein H-NS
MMDAKTHTELLIKKYKKDIDWLSEKQDRLLEEALEIKETVRKIRKWVEELEEDETSESQAKGLA